MFWNRKQNTRDRQLITNQVLDQISAERVRQFLRFGDQDMPNGINQDGDAENEVRSKVINAEREAKGTSNWRGVLIEEVAEACNAESQKHLEEELIQVAAVCVSWVEAIRDGRAVWGK